MRLVREDALVERQHHARDEQVVGKDGVSIELAVAPGALVHADSTRRLVLTAGIDVEHVAPELRDVESPVTVERHRRRADDVGIRQYELEVITRRQDETLGFLLGRHRGDGRFWTVVAADVRGISQTGTASAPAWSSTAISAAALAALRARGAAFTLRACGALWCAARCRRSGGLRSALGSPHGAQANDGKRESAEKGDQSATRMSAGYCHLA